MYRLGYEVIGDVPAPPRGKYQLTRQQTQELVRAVGDNGFILVTYLLFLEAVKEKNLAFGPEAISDYFGWSLDKSKRVLGKLKKAGIYRKECTRGGDIRRHTYILDLTHFPPKGA